MENDGNHTGVTRVNPFVIPSQRVFTDYLVINLQLQIGDFFHKKTRFAEQNGSEIGKNRGSLLLPGTLFVTIGLKALAALVLRHLQTTFLFQVTHGACFLM